MALRSGNRSFAVLVMATALLALAAWWVLRGVGEYRLPSGAGSAVWPQLPAQASDAARIRIEGRQGTVDLRRDGAVWRVEQKAGYPADVAKIADLLRELAALRLSGPRTSDPARYGDLEVAGPRAEVPGGVLVEVFDGAGETLVGLVVGKPRAGPKGAARQIYVRRATEAQAWLADGSVALATLPKLWLRRGLIDIPQARIQAVQVQWPGEAPYTVSRNSPDSPFVLEPLAPGETPSAAAMNAASYALQTLVLQDVRAGAGEPAAPQSPPPAAPPETLTGSGQAAQQARFRTFDGLEVTVLVTRGEGPPQARFTVRALPDASGGSAVAQEAATLVAALGPWVFELAPHTVETFLRPRTAVLEAPPDAPGEMGDAEASGAPAPGPPAQLRGPGRALPFGPPR